MRTGMMNGARWAALLLLAALAWPATAAAPVPGQHLPALREANFEVGVSLDEKTLADWPRQDDAVTLIRLDQGRVVGHEYAGTEAQLKAALGL